jgi:hypothetical protein
VRTIGNWYKTVPSPGRGAVNQPICRRTRISVESSAPQIAWQQGYSAFTVSASQRAAVGRYIEQQDEHHRTRSFREEYLELLRRSGVEFDERYV